MSEDKGAKIEVNENKPEKDFFDFEKHKDPNFHYHWAENDPRRIQELQRKGYEIDPNATAKEAREKTENQRNYLERQMNDERASKGDREMAKEMLARMSTGTPLSTVANIPGHVMMRTSVENRRKIMEARKKKSDSMGDQLQQDIHDLNKALQRSGKGGIKAFQDLFDKIKN